MPQDGARFQRHGCAIKPYDGSRRVVASRALAPCMHGVHVDAGDAAGALDEIHLESGRFVPIGRIGGFVPVTAESGLGGTLWRIQDEKRYAVTGTKGYLWMEAELALAQGVNPEIDTSYHQGLIDDAIKAIGKFGDFEEFVK